MTRKGVRGNRMRWVACVCAMLIGAPAAQAETIALIGTGNVGAALGERFAGLGHVVIYGSRDPTSASTTALVAKTGPNASAATPRDAAQRARIVVLGVPWDTVEEVVRGLGDLSGKIVVDPSNPRITTAEGLRDYAVPTSNAELIQSLAPLAVVVKAFNTLAAETMLDPASAGGPVTIPIVGDNADAKAAVAALARGIGLEAIDVGPLRHARIIEGLHFLRYNAVGGPLNFHFRLENN